MKKPTHSDAQEWIDYAHEQITRAHTRASAGLREKDQSFYDSLANDYATLGRAKYLHGDPLGEIREAFKQAAQNMEISFIMAYDESSPHYIGNKPDVDWSCVMEVHMLELMVWALISYDIEYAVHVTQWVRPSPDEAPMQPEVVHFVYALRYVLEGNWQEADAMNSHTFNMYQSQMPASDDYRRNYYTLSWALAGILRQDDEMFNEGLRQQLDFYRSYANGEAEDTEEEYFCDNALALAILGKKTGRILKIEGDYLPIDLV